MRYIHLPPGSLPPDIRDMGPHKTVVIIDGSIDGELQSKISRWIVDSGCYHMMAWGDKCSSWDDSVDVANMEKFNYGDIPENELVMTTWHENDSLSHVFWFCGNCVNHGSGDETEVVLLDITPSDRRNAILELYAAAQQGDGD